MLTLEDQIQTAHNALHFLEIRNPHLARTELLDAIAGTPTDSPLYPALIGTVNWLDLGNPNLATQSLAEALYTIEYRAFSA